MILRYSLAVIESRDENNYIRDRIGTSHWIGVSDKETQRKYKSVHGNLITWANWDSGEPNNLWGGKVNQEIFEAMLAHSLKNSKVSK